MIPRAVLEDEDFNKLFVPGPERVAVTYEQGTGGPLESVVGQIAYSKHGPDDPLDQGSLFIFPTDSNHDETVVSMSINTRFVVAITNRFKLETEEPEPSE